MPIFSRRMVGYTTQRGREVWVLPLCETDGDLGVRRAVARHRPPEQFHCYREGFIDATRAPRRAMHLAGRAVTQTLPDVEIYRKYRLQRVAARDPSELGAPREPK
jgi:hypothetical protein